jgi:hypothetical protein
MKRKIVKLKVKKKGQKPIEFKAGALRAQLGVKKDEKISAGKMKAAEEGKMGPLAKKRALFKKNVLTGKK